MARVTAQTFRQRKAEGKRLAVLTAYDFPTAKLVDAAGVDAILVGDTLGMVVMGLDSTLPVSMDIMVHHVSMVARGAHRSLIIADLPFLSYQVSPAAALENAGRLVVEGGAQAVKLEGPVSKFGDAIRGIVDAGIPLMGHLGLTPQSVHAIGGYKVQGRDPKARQQILDDAKALEDAGCFSVVLECVPRELGAEISQALTIPTIGIGAGPECDGQVLVFHDLLGWGGFRFSKAYADVPRQITDAVATYAEEVRSGAFPTEEHSYA